MIHAKVVLAGPRGNKCRECDEKTKDPGLILKTTGEYNRFTGHPTQDNFCAKCGKEKLEKGLERLKEMLEVLEHGPSDSSQLGNRKVRRV